MATAADVRRIVAELPGTAEKAAWGKPCFRVRDKIFAALGDADPRDPGEDEGDVLGFSIDRGDRAELIAAEPDRFFLRSGHDDKYHFARARLARLDEAELREVLTDAWRRIAPKKLVAEHTAAEHPARRFDNAEPPGLSADRDQ